MRPWRASLLLAFVLSASPAVAAPADEAARHVPDHDILAVGPWPGAGGFDDVIGVVARPIGASDRKLRVFTWFRRSEAGPAPEDRAFPLGEIEPTAVAAIDVTGDGRRELAVFASRGGEVSKTLEIFDLPPGLAQPLILMRETAALDGARTEQDVNALLPLGRGLLKNDIATASLTAIVGRASFATAKQFRALVGPQGLQLCDLVAENYENPRRSCRRVRVTDKAFERDIQPLFENALTPMASMGYACDARSCRVDQSGGYGKEFEFRGTGARRTLARITRIDHGLGE